MENTKNMGSSAAVFEDGGTQQTNRKTVSARQMKESAERKIEYAAAMGEVRKRESAAYAAREVGKLKAGLTADTNRIAQLALRLFTGFNLAVCVLLAIVGYRLGIFTSVESLQAWVNGFGIITFGNTYDFAVSLAPFLNMVITIPINFVMNKFWAYRQKDKDPKAKIEDTAETENV